MLKGLFHFCALLAVSAGMLFSSLAYAQEEKHDVKITLSSINELQTQASAISGKINPALPLMVQMMFAQSAMYGLDNAKPIQITIDVTDDGKLWNIYAPVTNMEMFKQQVEALHESGSILDVKITEKDGYALVTTGEKELEALPNMKIANVLEADLAPEMLAPYTALAAQQNPDVNPEEALKQLLELKKISFALDFTDAGDVLVKYTCEPKEGTDSAKNFANSAKLTKTALGKFYDSAAPASAQVLAVFDEETKEKFITQVTTAADIPERFKDAILLAADVKKIDGACSFYTDENGIYGFGGIGISNGQELNSRIEKAIEKANADAEKEIKGTANAAKIGKSINVHELIFRESKMAVGVHPKYIFFAYTRNGQSPIPLLKKSLKGNSVGTVSKSVAGHFDTALLQPALKDLDFDFTGKISTESEYEGGKLNSVVKIESAFIETVGKIYQAIQAKNQDDENEDLFEDEESGEDSDSDEEFFEE